MAFDLARQSAKKNVIIGVCRKTRIFDHFGPIRLGGMGMELRVEVEEKIPVLDIAGEIDHFVAPKLQRQIDELIDAGNDKLVFDFTAVNYLDSGGIGVLFNAMQQLVARQGRIGIVCSDPNVVRILELVGLFDKKTNVSLFDQRTQALKQLKRKLILAESSARRRELEVQSTGDNLAEVRNFVAEVADNCGFDTHLVYDIKVAVGEAIANAVEHGSPLGEANRIKVVCDCAEDTLNIKVIDEGVFKRSIPNPEENVGYRGHGILLMLALMDKVSIDESDHGTTVSLAKHLPSQADTGSRPA